MKFRIAIFDGIDLLILLLAVGAFLFIGALLIVADVELFLAGESGAEGGDDLVGTSKSESLELAETHLFGLDKLLGKEKQLAGERSEPVDLNRPSRPGLKALLSARAARDVALFRGLIYIATDGGLLVYRPSGELAAHYTHLNGLPSNRLRCLVIWRGDLWIGSDSGLTRLRKGVATSFTPLVKGGKVITALLPAGEKLLAGTDGAGLLSFDGRLFRRDVGRLPGAEFRKVTALTEWRGQLVVGSSERGLFAFVRLDETKGLPDNHVTALAPGERLLAATVTGVCSIDEHLEVTPWSRGEMASALLQTRGKTLVGTLDGRVESYVAGRRRDQAILGNRSRPVLINRIAVADNRTWVLTSS